MARSRHSSDLFSCQSFTDDHVLGVHQDGAELGEPLLVFELRHRGHFQGPGIGGHGLLPLIGRGRRLARAAASSKVFASWMLPVATLEYFLRRVIASC